jgi:hypothetical protein
MKFSAALLAYTASATAIGQQVGLFTVCGTTTDAFNFANLTIAPYPVEAGRDVTFALSGELLKNVTEGAQFKIVSKIGFITVDEKTEDLCAKALELGLSCPLLPGNITIQSSDAVPNVPFGGTATVKINISNGDGSELGCLEGKIKIVKPAQ